ncbi:MAG: MAPEG family protein [Maricaulis sp.]|jgi:glutathione S-transferase|nr:MAPEG family protein [Maricaulis sp.]MDG2044563.1 MAPEG family protein [Maricaulis sp.]
MIAAYPLTTLATLAIVLLTFIFSFRAGKSRASSGVSAPAMAGDDTFERATRVHMNTLEQMVLFVPVLWIFAMLVSDLFAGIAAVVWLVGRVMYSQAYMTDPSKRTAGFMLGILALLITFVWSIVMVVMGMMAG